MSSSSVLCIALVAQQEVTSGVLSGPSAGEGWLLGGGVGKLQEATTRLPLHRSAALCQDEEDGCGVSPLYLFFSIQNIKTVYLPQSHLDVPLNTRIRTSTSDSETERMTPALHKRSCLSFCPWLCKARGLFEVSLTKRETRRHFASGILKSRGR